MKYHSLEKILHLKKPCISLFILRNSEALISRKVFYLFVFNRYYTKAIASARMRILMQMA